MQTNASFVRISLIAVAALAAAACAGPSMGPSKAPTPGTSGGTGGSTGTGGNGSGGETGTGGGGSGGGGGGSTGGTSNPDGGTTGGTPDGGVTPTLSCSAYVTCLANAMSDADAMACDSKATTNATSLLDAVDQCVGNYCLGMSGATARCKQSATDGSMENLDGTPAFDANTGAPTGDCGACLLNGEAGLFGEACMPTTDPACNTATCASQTSACQADK